MRAESSVSSSTNSEHLYSRGGSRFPLNLRHTFCSHLAMRGAPARAIQELAGHADLSTTQIYTHILEARLRSVYERFHPRP